MVSELVQLGISIIQFIWPFRIVEEWEAGGYYVFGRWVRRFGPLKPGMYPVIPWFFDVKTISLAEAIVGTGRQDITLKDGKTLSFDARCPVRVSNPYLALNKVDSYKETAGELLGSVVAEKLSSVEPERLDPDKRARLCSDLKLWVNKEAEEYGLEFRRVRFASFLHNPKTIRLMVDQTKAAEW